MRFMDKGAVVTGGGSSIGKEIAKRFVANGRSVVIAGRDQAKLDAAANEIDTSGDHVATFAGDIAKAETCPDRGG